MVSVGKVCGLIHCEDLSISIGHGSTTQLHSNQELVYSTGNSMGTGLASKCDVEQGNPIQDQLPGSGPGIVLEQVNNVGGELWFGVIIHSRGQRCGSVVDSHLEDELIIRLVILVVPSQRVKDFGKSSALARFRRCSTSLSLAVPNCPSKV